MYLVLLAVAMVSFVACGMRSAFEKEWLNRVKWIIAGSSAFTFFVFMSGAIYWST